MHLTQNETRTLVSDALHFVSRLSDVSGARQARRGNNNASTHKSLHLFLSFLPSLSLHIFTHPFLVYTCKFPLGPYKYVHLAI